MDIRPLTADDWDQWLPLWAGYLDFYRAALSDDTSKATFAHLCASDEDMFGYLAVDADGQGAGLVHCVVHPSTWSRRPSCYLEDLFVKPEGRSTGLAKALIDQAKTESLSRGARTLYWHTQEYNGRARSLYDQVAHLTSFVVYEM